MIDKKILPVALLLTTSVLVPPSADAFSMGISTQQFGMSACNQCHLGAAAPAVTLSGPTTVSAGSTNEYLLTITTPLAAGGLNVSALDGAFATGGSDPAGTQAIAGSGGRDEITHTAAKAAAAGSITFSFLWTAPLSFVSTDLVAWGNAVDGNSQTSGDQAAFDILSVMNADTPSPSPTATATPLPIGDKKLAGRRLNLRDPKKLSRRSMRFRSVRDPTLVAPPSSDPSAVGASLAVTGLGVGDGRTGLIDLPASGWRALGKPPGSRGYKFKGDGSASGVRAVVLKPRAKGGFLAAKARKENWPYAITQPQAGVQLLLKIGDDVYCSLFDPSSMVENEAGHVSARDAVAPLDCALCSNGHIDEFEECDDGNLDDGDGCSSSCLFECGNGAVDGSEECDDGNLDDGDGCSSTCLIENESGLCAGIAPVAGTSMIAELVTDQIDLGTSLTAPPLDTRRLFVTEQPGLIRVIRDGTLLATPFLDISALVYQSTGTGLLGLAFHPDYKTNGRFFVHYADLAGNVILARYEVSPGDPDVADPSSGQILLTVPGHLNHDGGQLAFGPDGYLYQAIGDGPEQCGLLGNSQNDFSIDGKLLRIDVDVESPPYYAIPPSNPNAGLGDPFGLVWAKGLRNPWRFSFDRGTGDVYIADVGQVGFEEINFQPAASIGGEDYGWNFFEGQMCFDPEAVCGHPPHAGGCPDPTPFTFPIHEYDHGLGGCSITGGFVYRGCRLPDLHGTYFYADFCGAFVRTFEAVAGVAQNHQDVTAELFPAGGFGVPTSFGEDARGELYVITWLGNVFRIIPSSP